MNMGWSASINGTGFMISRDVIKKNGAMCAVSDFAILLGAYVSSHTNVAGDFSMRGRTGWWYLSSFEKGGEVYTVTCDGYIHWTHAGKRSGSVRPVLPYSSIYDISQNGVRNSDGVLEVEYGEYPQDAVSYRIQIKLTHTL